MHRIFILFLLAGFSPVNIYAQNILSFIPKEASNITVVKGDRIHDTYAMKDVMKLEPYQKFEENFEEEAEDSWYGFNVIPRYDGQKMGIDHEAKYFSFRESNDSLNIYASIFEVNSKRILDAYIEKIVGEDKWKEKSNSGTFEYLMNEEFAIAWNGQFFIYYNGRVQYYYVNRLLNDDNDYYLEELSEKERTERDVQRAKIKEDLIEKDLQRLFSLNFEDAILSERKFMDLLSRDYDSFTFMNHTFKNIGQSSRSRYNRYEYGYDEEYYEDVQEEVEPNPLLEGNYTYHFWKFDKEELTSQTHIALNPELFKHVKKMVDGKFNKDYNKYIASDKVMGYYSVAVDPKGTFQMMQALSINPGNYIPGVGGASNRVMTLLGALIDKKKALKILNGDALFVVTDMKEVDVRYESYAYNKEDYVRERIIKTKKEKRPEFIFMTSSNYDGFVEKALGLLEEERRLVKMGNYYMMKPKRDRYGGGDLKEGSVDTYLAYKDGILIITNNEKTVSDYLDKGYPKERQLDSKKFKEITDQDFNMFWNLDVENSDDMNLPSFVSGMFNTYDNMFDQFELNGMEADNNVGVFSGTYRIKKKEDNDYGMLYLLDMLTGLTDNPNMLSVEEDYRY